jgi:CubicO group peptidase (beta-lactamase class C family)
VHSLLIMRNGEMVMEEYFQLSYNNDLHTIQSVTKSVTSAAIGIAIQEGMIAGVNEKVVDFFPEQRATLIQNQRRAAMTLQDVLTMRTGTDYNENGASSPHWQLNALPTGWDDFWLARPMVADPGTVWQYDSGGVIALSSMIKDRYGSHADVFIDEKLFGPLGITRRKWFRNQEQHPHTGGGLNMRALDMLAFGRLFLQRGKWEGVQLINEAWIDASFAKQHVFNPPMGNSRLIEGYGYLWWILKPDPAGDRVQNIYAAMGAKGQFIFVLPEYEMVIAVTSNMSNANWFNPVLFLYSDILPAITQPLPVSTEQNETGLEIGYLEPNSPNPASSLLRIGFATPTPGPATITLYDLLGRRVQDMYSGFASPARTEVQVNISDLPPGMYVYRIESGDWSATRKLLISK